MEHVLLTFYENEQNQDQEGWVVEPPEPGKTVTSTTCNNKFYFGGLNNFCGQTSIKKLINNNQPKKQTKLQIKHQNPHTKTTTMRMKPLKKLRIPLLRLSLSVIKVLIQVIRIIKLNKMIRPNPISQYFTRIFQYKI